MRKNCLFALLLLVVGLLTTTTGTYGAPDPKNKKSIDWDGKTYLDVCYKRIGDRRILMDIYLPPKKIDVKSPVIYYVHGGGWAVGNKSKFGNRLMLPVFRQLADKGFVCVSVSYRLWRKNGDVLMRDCVTDAMDGLRYLNQHCEQYGIDSDRIVVFGDSAGGQLAQMLTYASPDGFPGNQSLVPFGVKPIAGISWYGPSDFTDVHLFETAFSDKNPNRFGLRITGEEVSPEDKRKAFEEMSSYYWIQKDSPPLLLIQGDGDATIPVAHAIHLKRKADRIGADVETIIVKHAGHNWRSFEGTPEPGVEEIQKITVDFACQRVDVD